MTSCIIVDDQPLSRQLLSVYVDRHPRLQLAGVCSNAMEAFDCLHNKQPSLVLLDIQMPSMTGISFIRSLKSPPAFIFVTAFPEHAVISYELNAVDYLLKPVTYERFCTSIDKLLKIQAKPVSPPDYTYFKVEGCLVKLMHSNILYAQSIKDYILIFTTDGKYITHMTMKYLTELLPSGSFKRVHRSYLVGTRHISAISKNEVRLGGITVPVGESYRERVWKMFLSA